MFVPEFHQRKELLVNKILKFNPMKKTNLLMAAFLCLAFSGMMNAQEVTINSNMKVEADGTLQFQNNATTFEDLRVTLDKGSSSAALEYFSGESGPQIWYFRNAAGLESMSFTVQLPHAWKEGSTIFPHLHWTPRATRTGDVEWNFEYTWANYNPTTPVVFPAITTNTVVATGPFTANTHLITPLSTANAGLVATGKTVSSILICKIWRNSGNVADTYADDAGLLFIDFHYEVDALGSRQEYVK